MFGGVITVSDSVLRVKRGFRFGLAPKTFSEGKQTLQNFSL